MACNDKLNLTCGVIQSSVCISYDGDLPEYSELECPNAEEVLEEHYNLITRIREANDFSNLGNACLTYPQGDLTAAEVALVFETKICELADTIATMQAAMNTMNQQIQDLENNCP